MDVFICISVFFVYVPFLFAHRQMVFDFIEVLGKRMGNSFSRRSGSGSYTQMLIRVRMGTWKLEINHKKRVLVLYSLFVFLYYYSWNTSTKWRMYSYVFYLTCLCDCPYVRLQHFQICQSPIFASAVRQWPFHNKRNAFLFQFF